MTLPREFVIPGLLAEYGSFAELVRGLSNTDWTASTRCHEWQVADVAGHVVGQLTDVVNLCLDGVGTPEVTKRQTDERRGRRPSELAGELESSLAVAAG
ncbi:MAG TPA: maleylpyruvate isomerase N-terminal domain-containing protein, partial [Acidimicrobiales bacterium]|nr:maleylpyruvate isomerase N-terminal domain-containing protein [Acidimicrobiales bacterium]